MGREARGWSFPNDGSKFWLNPPSSFRVMGVGFNGLDGGADLFHRGGQEAEERRGEERRGEERRGEERRGEERRGEERARAASVQCELQAHSTSCERAARAARAKPELTSCPNQTVPDLCRSNPMVIYNRI